MKNFILVFAIFFASFALSHAQQLSGRFFIEGSLGFGYSSSTNMTVSTIQDRGDPNTSLSFSISPSVGYYLSDQWAVGIETSYRNGQNKQYSYNYNITPIKLLSTTSSTSNSFSIAPLLRYSLPITDKIIFNLTLTTPYTSSLETQTTTTDNVTSPTIEQKKTSYGAVLRPALQWFVKDNIAVVGGIGVLSYSHTKIEQTSSSQSILSSDRTSNDFYLSLTSNFSLGILIYLGGM